MMEAALVLSTEVLPDDKPQDASPEYRSSLTQALLYKVTWGMWDDILFLSLIFIDLWI